MSFWCLQISQKTNDFFSRISALASKKRSNQKKIVEESQNKILQLAVESALIFLILPLFRGKVRNPGKNFIVFFGRFEDTKRTF